MSEVDPYPAYTETMGVTMNRMDGEQEKEISIVLMNESAEKIPVGEAMVTTYSADRYQKHKMILPGGLTWASSIEDVKAPMVNQPRKEVQEVKIYSLIRY